MTTPEKLKQLEDIIIDFNEYLQTVTDNLKHLETGVQDIVSNIRTEINELSKGTTEIITDMRKDLEQGSTVVAELFKTINSLKSISSTISSATISSCTTPTASSTTPTIISPTIISEPYSSPSFLEKEKEMQELKAKTIIKKYYNYYFTN